MKIAILVFTLSCLLIIYLSCESKTKKVADENFKEIFVTVQKNADGATFFITTTNKFETMTTISMNSKNLSSEVSFPFSFTSIGADKVQLFTLKQINPTESWHYNFTFKWRAVISKVKPDLNFVYDLPFETNSSFELSQGYNGDISHQPPYQYSYDFKMPIGTPIVAAREGMVVNCKSNSNVGGPSIKYWNDANFVSILHNDGTIANYLHLKKKGVLFSIGDKVQKGTLIGYSGNTGYSTGPHLHFEVNITIDGLTHQSIPITVRTKSGEFSELIKGVTYQAVR